jgi:hypothetical protein
MSANVDSTGLIQAADCRRCSLLAAGAGRSSSPHRGCPTRTSSFVTAGMARTSGPDGGGSWSAVIPTFASTELLGMTATSSLPENRRRDSQSEPRGRTLRDALNPTPRQIRGNIPAHRGEIGCPASRRRCWGAAPHVQGRCVNASGTVGGWAHAWGRRTQQRETPPLRTSLACAGSTSSPSARSFGRRDQFPRAGVTRPTARR